jgi:hypothetical protein
MKRQYCFIYAIFPRFLFDAVDIADFAAVEDGIGGAFGEAGEI